MWFLGVSWGLTVVATIGATFLLSDAFLGANGAPQQAALGAMSAAVVIIPYVFTRAVEALVTSKSPAPEAQTGPANAAEW